MAADFQSELQAKKELVDKALNDYLASIDVSTYSAHGQQAWAMLQDFSSRPGKRFRGSMLLVSYEMCGGDNHEEAMKAAVAMELVQNYLLIVDDVMDRSEIRRTKPTLQYMYLDEIEEEAGEDAKHLSDMLAVNVGLLASHVAGQLMNELDLPADRVVAANQKFHENIKQTTYGQVDDLYSGVGHTSVEDIMMTHELKSSYYTFINPMQVGAILAGADEKQIETIHRFGVPAGIAFQLQDDILGLSGNDKETGKAYLDDLKEGKRTLLMQNALDMANKDGAIKLVEALGNPNVSEEMAAEVRDIVTECGARKKADAEARSQADTARAVIADLEWPGEGASFLDGLLDYVVERLN